jgi:hypothetical protein
LLFFLNQLLITSIPSLNSPFGYNFGYNIGMSYRSWKGLKIKDAEKIRDELSKKLARQARKRDFIASGYYSAWMALYRYKKNTTPSHEDLEKKYISFRRMISESGNKDLVKSIFKDFVNKLGIDKAEIIIDSMRNFSKK